MNYGIQNGQIVVFDTSQFDICHILDSGQVFRYEKAGNIYKIVAKNVICHLKYENDRVIINSSNTDFAINYFDLYRDYEPIKNELKKHEYVSKAVNYGNGIRILNQDPLEVIVSFIISANNNIPRIKGILNRLCERLGEDMGGYRAFPTLEKMAGKDVNFYKEIGLGYRAEYMVKTIADIKNGFDLDLYHWDTIKARKHLTTLTGVGRKVADCILLFAYHKEDVFPMDTWCKRIYRDLGLPVQNNCGNMADILTKKFDKLSGYAQQYLFYYYRENNIL
ncbi:MAG: DNA-3-methyladenine glycosylase family protein [Bacillota bacterium]